MTTPAEALKAVRAALDTLEDLRELGVRSESGDHDDEATVQALEDAARNYKRARAALPDLESAVEEREIVEGNVAGLLKVYRERVAELEAERDAWSGDVGAISRTLDALGCPAENAEGGDTIIHRLEAWHEQVAALTEERDRLLEPDGAQIVALGGEMVTGDTAYARMLEERKISARLRRERDGEKIEADEWRNTAHERLEQIERLGTEADLAIRQREAADDTAEEALKEAHEARQSRESYAEQRVREALERLAAYFDEEAAKEDRLHTNTGGQAGTIARIHAFKDCARRLRAQEKTS